MEISFQISFRKERSFFGAVVLYMAISSQIQLIDFQEKSAGKYCTFKLFSSTIQTHMAVFVAYRAETTLVLFNIKAIKY
jgi:hypothetical protein